MSWRAELAGFAKGIAVLGLFSVTVNFAMPGTSGADIVLGAPSADTVDVTGSAAFTAQLEPASGFTGAVTYEASGQSTPPGLLVSSSGEVTTTGVLAATTYTVSGSDNDSPNSDTGSWTYVLTVTPDSIAQGSPMANTVSVVNSAAFVDSLNATSPNSNTVTYDASEPSAPAGLIVSNSGGVTTTGTLAATTYTISGSDADQFNDVGSWSYSLTVNPVTIVQGSPMSGATSTVNSATFGSTLGAASGFVGAVAFTTSTPGFTIANGDGLESTGPLSSSDSPYSISGSDSDSYGDGGTWTYSLTVLPVGVKSTIMQTSATTGTVSTASSATYVAGPISVEDNTGAVTFVTTKSSTALSVSSTGSISTSGPLAVGTYSVAGTDSDAAGDSGTWTYTLTVTGVVVAVTFEPNGGTGIMAPQSESQPTSLSLNSYTWSNHTFVDWNTSANGTGVSYANGAPFPFTAATTLFAQWKTGKAPSKTIAFVANGGTGSMSPETDNTPTAISATRFTRTGYTFVNWNTTAKGTGTSYGAGVTYSFKQSVTLFAQWKKAPAISYLVTFVANGGRGVMAAERHHGPTTLTPNRFTRSGYTFVTWNASPSGTGVSLANRAKYSFSGSITLYAQWKKIKKIVPPPVKRTGPVVGPFALTTSELNPTLDSEVGALADQMKAKGDSQVTLQGYGDELSAKDAQQSALVAANTELGRMRAQSVATYLANRLAALGLKGWTISIGAASVSASNSFNAGMVLASLS